MKHTEITTYDTGRSLVEITDDAGRTLTLVIKGSQYESLGVIFCDERGEINDWHITPDSLYDLLWSAFGKEG